MSLLALTSKRLPCVDFRIFDSIAVCFVGLDWAVSKLQRVVSLTAYVTPCTLNRFVR